MLGLLTAAALACAPPEGASTLLDRPEQVIMIGELHGTAEAPHAVGEIACAAAERGPVVVALELEDTLQPTLDAFMAAPTRCLLSCVATRAWRQLSMIASHEVSSRAR